MTMKTHLSSRASTTLASLAALILSTSALAQTKQMSDPMPPPPKTEAADVMPEAADATSADAMPAPSPSANHFQCYRVYGSTVATPNVPLVTIDQFGKTNIVIGQAVSVCNPTIKYHNGRKFGVADKKNHLVCYAIVRQEPQKPRIVKTRDQFRTAHMKMEDRTMFCAPATKKLVGGQEYPLD